MEPEQTVLNGDEYERVQLEKLQKLVELNKLFGLPGWKVAEEIVRDLISAYSEELLKAKDLSEVFHLQGQVLGLQTLGNLPAYAQSEAMNIQNAMATWKTSQEQKKGR